MTVTCTFVHTEGAAPAGAVGRACFTTDRRFRWSLGREWPALDAPPRAMVMIGLNPSGADARRDDHTVRRVRHFAMQYGCNRFTLVNLSPLISTDPAGLLTCPQDWPGPWCVDGLANDRVIAQAVQGSPLVVVAWGASLMRVPEVQARAAAVRNLLAGLNVHPYCLGFTQGGHPRYPSRLPNEALLLDYSLLPAVPRTETVPTGGLL